MADGTEPVSVDNLREALSSGLASIELLGTGGAGVKSIPLSKPGSDYDILLVVAASNIFRVPVAIIPSLFTSASVMIGSSTGSVTYDAGANSVSGDSFVADVYAAYGIRCGGGGGSSLLDLICALGEAA